MNELTQKKDNPKAIIVQYEDDTKTLPDGSKIIYAENDDKIVLYHKVPFEKGRTFVYERKSGNLIVNGKEGNGKDKREMVKLGAYFIENSSDSDMVTINVYSKG